MPITIHGDYERASVSLGYSSVSGDGDTAVVELAPGLQASSDVSGGERRWLEFGARLSGVMGLRPLVRVTGVTDYPQAYLRTVHPCLLRSSSLARAFHVAIAA